MSIPLFKLPYPKLDLNIYKFPNTPVAANLLRNRPGTGPTPRQGSAPNIGDKRKDATVN